MRYYCNAKRLTEFYLSELMCTVHIQVLAVYTKRNMPISMKFEKIINSRRGSFLYYLKYCQITLISGGFSCLYGPEQIKFFVSVAWEYHGLAFVVWSRQGFKSN